MVSTADEIIKMTRGFMFSKLIFLAHELGVWDVLSKGGKGAQEVACELGISLKGCKRLLNALVGIGVLTKEEGVYAIADGVRGSLVEEGEESIRHYIGLSAFFWHIWDRMDKVIREGAPIVSMMELIAKDDGMLKMFSLAMADRARDAARLLPKVVDISSRRRMLDVGAGPGTYSIEWMKMYPKLTSTLVDIPRVLEIAEDHARSAGVYERCEFKPGNFYDMDLGRGIYDLALVANVLQMYGEDEARMLMGKVFSALSPRGLLVIHGYATDDSETQPAGSAIFAMSIAAVTEKGGAHRVSDKIRWMKDAGFTNIATTEIQAIPPTVIWGEKP
ncbi:MAG: class I SAM-dependent methyltransferase [Candidatus Caldarchaeum sp.]